MYGEFPSQSPKPYITPFVLYKDGKMDFGDQYTHLDDKDRFETCDVFNNTRNRKIEIGANICITSEEVESLYRVVKIVDIASSVNIKR